MKDSKTKTKNGIKFNLQQKNKKIPTPMEAIQEDADESQQTERSLLQEKPRINRDEIYEEQLNKIKTTNSQFHGIAFRENHYFFFSNKKNTQLSAPYELVNKDRELLIAIQREKGGYSKPGMYDEEIEEERLLIEEHLYSLDFMLEGQEMQEEDELQDFIMRQVTKDTQQKLEDHAKYDGNLTLREQSPNGYVQAVF